MIQYRQIQHKERFLSVTKQYPYPSLLCAPVHAYLLAQSSHTPRLADGDSQPPFPCKCIFAASMHVYAYVITQHPVCRGTGT